MIFSVFSKILRLIKGFTAVITDPFKETRLILLKPWLWGYYAGALKDRLKKHLKIGILRHYKPEEYAAFAPEKTVYRDLEYNPLISILIPIYNIERKYLCECLDSILAQKYQNFEVCLADDCSTLSETLDTLSEYEQKDRRIKVIRRTENGHIARATNSALSIATGEFIALMDDDDLLTEDALYCMAEALNRDPTLDFIYSHEDKDDINGAPCDPHFKPDFSPDSLLGGNYICHFEIIRRSLVEKIGGEEHAFVGAQDFDLFLKITEITDRIHHIPKVLYHWRKVPGSTADTIENKDYAIEAGRRAVLEHLKRKGIKGSVSTPYPTTHYRVSYQIEGAPLLSVLVSTSNNAQYNKFAESFSRNAGYYNTELIAVSEKTGALSLSEAVLLAKGEYILFISDNIEIESRELIPEMLGYAQRDHIGAVGAMLLRDDRTIYCGGIYLSGKKLINPVFKGQAADFAGFNGKLLTPYNYSAVPSECMLIKKDKILSVGGLDGSFTALWSTDLCMRLCEKGFYNVLYPYNPPVRYAPYNSLSESLRLYRAYKKELSLLKKRDFKDKFYNQNYHPDHPFMLKKGKKI